jgi:hypothetical protein
VEVRWRSLFRSTSLGKRCTSYNAHPLLENVLQTVCRKLQEPRSSLYMVGKAQKSHGVRSELHGICSNDVPPISVSASIAAFQSRNADAPLKLLRHPKKGSSKTTVTPFSRSGWSVVKVHLLPRQVLRKRDRHQTSTKFRFGVIRWVYELCKRSSYVIPSGYCMYKHNITFSKWIKQSKYDRI